MCKSNNSVQTTISKLNGKNFLPWKRQITIILKLKGLEKTINEDEEIDEKQDMQATLLLLGAMDEAHANQLQSEPSTKAIMDSLYRQYANRSEATLYRLLSDVINQKKKSEHNINQHIGQLEEMWPALKGIGEDISGTYST